MGVAAGRLQHVLHIPYTVILLLMGMFLGIIHNYQTDKANMGILGASIEIWNDIDPHVLLYIFLPPLIYEGPAAVDFHVFRRSAFQMLLLAGPGVMACTCLTAVIVKSTLTDYHWSWTACMTFGAMLSATDPVAVVALMKELGAPKQLSILIEGESLFNDGTAMAIFIICAQALETDGAELPSASSAILTWPS